DGSMKSTGTTAAGKAWTLSRGNRFAAEDTDDITLRSVAELASALDQLQANTFEQVRFTGVQVQATVAPQWRAYQLGPVEAKAGAHWGPGDHHHPHPAPPGTPTHL